jgi:hypothetical protein
VRRLIGVLAVVWVAAASVTLSAQSHHGGPLPHNIPDFCATPSLSTVTSGAWADPAIWSAGRVPVAGDVARVSHGTSVVYGSVSDEPLTCLSVDGTLTFRTDIVTRLTVGTLMVMPGAALNVGRGGAPVQAGVTAEIVIADLPLDVATDPEKFGTGLLAFGRVTMRGAARTPTFTRLASEPRAGHTTLVATGPLAGWQVGDRIALPDTRQLNASERFGALRSQAEDLTVTDIWGTTLTLSRPLTYDHVGARNASGVLELLPHVANVTRNVVVRSQNPSGTRGHTLFTHRAEVDIRYVLFKDLGRTTNEPLGADNQIGRYPLHIHHVMGPVNAANTGYQFRLVGNAVTDSLKWPLTVHNSHYGLVQDNVVFKGLGAGFVTEDGNESHNEFVRNFGLAITGDVNPRDTDGRDGSIFWFAGFNHIVRDNVAANAINHFQGIVNGAGYNFVVPAAGLVTRIPLFRGADLTVAGQYQTVDIQYVAIPEFRRNEAYGAMPTGLVVWNLGSDGYDVSVPVGQTLVADFVGWHLHESAFFGYPANRMTFDGFTVRGQSRALGIHDGGSGWWSGDYKNTNVTIRRADIQGMSSGIDVSHATDGRFIISDSFLKNYRGNISVPTLATPGTQATPDARTTYVINTRFEVMAGSPLSTIEMDWSLAQGNSHPQIPDRLFVFDYQGIAGDDFQVFYAEQATQNIAGGLATCTSTRAAIDGLVCPTNEPRPPGGPPSAIGGVRVVPSP